MVADWISGALTSGWALAAAGYGLGLLTGRILWRNGNEERHDLDVLVENGDLEVASSMREGREEPVLVANAADALELADDATPEMKLRAVETEIRNLKEILSADMNDEGLFSEILSSVDSAVKRANGRLKLILKAVKGLEKTGKG